MTKVKSLLEKARESARRARARAQMMGGETPLEVKQAVDEAVRRAKLRQQGGEMDEFDEMDEIDEMDEFDQEGGDMDEFDEFDEFEQEGGKKNFNLLKLRAEEKLAIMRDRMPYLLVSKLPSLRAVMNSLRTYKVFVGDNKQLLGQKRYFHGSPLAAARKVVAMLNKDIKMKDGSVKRAAMPSVGIENAVPIVLQEVTKGVHKSKEAQVPYVYEYFGWRQALAVPKRFVKGNRTIEVHWENVAVPKRGATTAVKAAQLSEAAAKKRMTGLAHARAAHLARGTTVPTTTSVLKAAPVVKGLQQLKERKRVAVQAKKEAAAQRKALKARKGKF